MKAFQCLVTLTSAQKGREQGTEGRIANTPQTRGDLILPLAMPQINSLLQIAKLGFFHPCLLSYMTTATFVGGWIRRPGHEAVSKRTQTTRQDVTVRPGVFAPPVTTGQGSWGVPWRACCGVGPVRICTLGCWCSFRLKSLETFECDGNVARDQSSSPEPVAGWVYF